MSDDGAAPPAAKRARTTALAGVTLFVPETGLLGGAPALAAWRRSLPTMGGAVTQDEACPSITHAVVPLLRPAPAAAGGPPAGNWAVLPAALRPGGGAAPTGLHYVTQVL